MIIQKTIYFFGFNALPIFSSIFYRKGKPRIDLKFQFSTKKMGRIECDFKIINLENKEICSIVQINLDENIHLNICEKCKYLDDGDKIHIKYYVQYANGDIKEQISLDRAYKHITGFDNFYFWTMLDNRVNIQMIYIYNLIKTVVLSGQISLD
jgi:hypothetical protein